MEETKEITLSDFMGVTSARKCSPGVFEVKIPLKDKTTGTLTIEKCESEFDAKERAYLYLKARLENPDPPSQ